MNKNLKLRAIVWEIIVPIVLYYIVFLSTMYFIFAFIGHTTSTYMIAQIISAAITIPFMYFASYKPTQQMFVKKPKIDRALFINVLWVCLLYTSSILTLDSRVRQRQSLTIRMQTVQLPR